MDQYDFLSWNILYAAAIMVVGIIFFIVTPHNPDNVLISATLLISSLIIIVNDTMASKYIELQERIERLECERSPDDQAGDTSLWKE